VRHRHFEELCPVCPVCRQQDPEAEHLLRLASVLREQDECVLEGVLHCSNSQCQREYPIIDGVPLILAGLREYAGNNVLPILSRTDLHPMTEGILGDCLGPGSAWDAMRYQLSCYAWEHYGSHDPEEANSLPQPGTTLAPLKRGLELCGSIPAGPFLDVGCSVGGMSFALAKRSTELVLGVDVNFAMLRVAQQVLRSGQVSYPRRRIGAVYDRREFQVPINNPQNVDFWACDATALPLPRSKFALAAALNILDCVSSPVELLQSLARTLVHTGRLIATSPYDWSAGATPFESWLGGHSQRGPDQGAGEPLLRRLLTPGGHPQSISGLKLLAEADGVPWTVRLHDRSAMNYLVQLLVAESRADTLLQESVS
jgi:SAM-dependent methyltransferase/uncharacterized protein YbaR (Trm112 family)